MNGLEILTTIVNDKVACKYLGGLMSIDRLHFKPKSRIFYICNTDIYENNGKHWIVMYYINNTFEYFDPLGEKPSIPFLNFMTKFTNKIILNTKQVQPLYSSTCGEYCIYFSCIRSRDVDFKVILSHMQNDQTVLDFVEDL